MKARYFVNCSGQRSRLFVGICLLASLAFLTLPPNTAMGHLSASAEHPGQPLSINPAWQNLGITWRVSVASDGTEGNSYSSQPSAITADGRYVVFISMATNLIPGDPIDAHYDVFLHDNWTGITERISVNSAGVGGNDESYYGVDVSADARYVAFTSKSNNLISGDTNGKWDVFVRDRQMSMTKRVSVSSSGSQSNGHAWLPRISDDGNIVVYTSEASNLVTGDTNNKWDIFAYNMANGQTERVSISSAEAQANGDSGNNKTPALSYDGRYIAFTSDATNLVTGDTNNYCDMNGDGTYSENCPDVFVRDRTAGTTERVSVNANAEEAANFSMLPAISGDGRYVAFYSGANNLVAGDTNICGTLFYYSGPCPDVFVRDRQSATTERVSVSSSGSQSTVDPINYFQPPAISSDGRYVAFESSDTTLATGATNGYSQILIHDRTTHSTTLVSASTFRWQGNSWSHTPPDLSATGRYVSFNSSASDLVMYDANGFADVFVRDREGWTYAVAGTVRDELNHPVAGVRVGYGYRSGEWKDTDTNGEYELYYMPTGVYTLTVRHVNYLADPCIRLLTVPPTTVGADFVVHLATDWLFLPVARR